MKSTSRKIKDGTTVLSELRHEIKLCIGMAFRFIRSVGLGSKEWIEASDEKKGRKMTLRSANCEWTITMSLNELTCLYCIVLSDSADDTHKRLMDVNSNQNFNDYSVGADRIKVAVDAVNFLMDSMMERFPEARELWTPIIALGDNSKT